MKLVARLRPWALTLTVATVAALGVVMLGLGQRDLRLAAITLVAILASLIVTDANGWFRLNRTLANVAGVAAVAMSVNDFIRFERDTQLLAVANLLIYLELVLLFQEKTPRVYWQILVLSLLEVVIGAALNLGAEFGVLLVAYMLLMLVTLMLLFYRRESTAIALAQSHAAATPPAGHHRRSHRVKAPFCFGEITVLAAQCDSTAPRGLLPVLASASLMTVFVTTAVFFSVPRYGNTTWQATSLAYQPTVGFSGTVSLGTLGAVADNPELVMRVEFRNENNPAEPYLLHGEPLFRGSILTQYARGEWRYPFTGQQEAQPLNRAPAFTDAVIQRITIERLDEPVLFGIHPMYRSRSRRDSEHVLYDPSRRQYIRSEAVQNAELNFETLTTGLRQGLQQPITPELFPLSSNEDASSEEQQLLQLPPPHQGPPTRPDDGESVVTPGNSAQVHDLPELAAAAQRQIELAGLSRDDPFFAFIAARTLELYLRSPPFRYSLQPQKRDPAIDPIEDFVKNNSSGHCEYFASALALMLRTQGIPARVVVGFKGGDFNQVGCFYQVRQLHAHAWVEAYLTSDQIPLDRRPAGFESKAGWLTLDPTPAADEGTGVNRGGFLNAVADLGDYLKHLWSSYIVGFNPERQRDAIYRPLADLASNIQELVKGGEGLHVVAWRWVRANALTVRGAVLLAVVVGLATLAIWQARRIVTWLWTNAGHRKRKGRRREPIEFYERLEEILGRYTIRRTEQQTPLEYALAAGAEMVAAADLRPHATLPRRIVEVYYRVRFGRHSLTKPEQWRIDEQLAQLAHVLGRHSRGGRRIP